MAAKIYYRGSLDSLTHTSRVTGNTYVFSGPNSPTVVNNEKDIAFYASKESFVVEVEVPEVTKAKDIPKEKSKVRTQMSEPEEVAEAIKKKGGK